MPAFQVFISHASEEAAKAVRLQHELQRNGFEVWLDRNAIHAGQQITREILQGAKTSDACVWLMSEKSVRSHWCLTEIALFLGKDKPVIPYLAQRSRSVLKKMPGILSGTHAAMSMAELVAALRETAKLTRVDPGLLQVCRAHGLASAFKIPEDNEGREAAAQRIIREELQCEEPCFCLLATSGYSYLHPKGMAWNKGFGEAVKHAKVRALLQSPFSEFGETRALANKRVTHHWHTRIDREELAQRCDEKFQVRITTHPVNCSLLLTRNAALYDPYLWGRPSETGSTENNFWVTEFRAAGERAQCDSHTLLTRHFEFLWAHSEPLETTLDKRRFENRGRAFAKKLRRMLGE